MKSDELLDVFLAQYKPDLPKEVLEAINESNNLQEEVEGLEKEMEQLREKINTLQQKIRETLVKANEGCSNLSYPDQLKLHPERIYEEMKKSVENKMAILGRTYRSDLDNLKLVINLLKGQMHAVEFIGAWEPIGVEYGDLIYKSLLKEAGFTLEEAELKYNELEKLPNPEDRFKHNFPK